MNSKHMLMYNAVALIDLETVTSKWAVQSAVSQMNEYWLIIYDIWWLVKNSPRSSLTFYKNIHKDMVLIQLIWFYSVLYVLFDILTVNLHCLSTGSKKIIHIFMTMNYHNLFHTSTEAGWHYLFYMRCTDQSKLYSNFEFII